MRHRNAIRAGLHAFLAGLVILLFGLSGAAHADGQSDALSIALGGQKILKLDRPIGRIAISDPKIIDVKVINSQELRLLGQETGSAGLTVWYSGSGGTVSWHCVVGADLDGLRAALADDVAFADVKVSNTGKTTVLNGQVYSLADRKRVEDIAASFVGKDIRNLIDVSDQRMVAVDIRFAAVSVDSLKELGFNLSRFGHGLQFGLTTPNSGTASLTGTGGSVNSSGASFSAGLPLSDAFNLVLDWPGANLSAALSMLSSANLAQMLAEPTLIVRSGEEADFLAGGEIPIPVPQSGNASGSVTIQYKKFGVQLGVQATVLSNDRIVMRVRPEVSELDPANGISIQGYSIPAIKTRSTRTTVELGDGQSFVLAGLMYTSSSNIEDKVPGVGDLPVIGAFFKRSQNERQQQELIVIATPHLVSPMEAGQTPKLPGEVGQKYDPSFGEMLLNTKQLDSHVVQYGLMR